MKSNAKNRNRHSGRTLFMAVMIALTTILAQLQLLHVISLPWWIVTLPVWGPPAGVVALATTVHSIRWAIRQWRQINVFYQLRNELTYKRK